MNRSLIATLFAFSLISVAMVSVFLLLALASPTAAQGTDVPKTSESGGSGCWSVVPSPNPGSGPGSLQGVSVLSANDAWAVGTYNGITTRLIEHWDGTTWSIVTPPSGQSGRLLDVEAIAPNDVWAVGAGGVNWPVIHWDGSTWSEVPIPSIQGGVELYSISAVSASDIWAVGNAGPSGNDATVALHWDGSQWSRVPSPSPSTNYNRLYEVSARASDDVWAVGSLHNSGVFNIRSLILHWNGSQWTQVSVPEVGTRHNELWGVHASASDEAWAVGSFQYDETSRSHSLILRWDGTSWQHHSSPFPGRLDAIRAIGPNDVWTVGRRIVFPPGQSPTERTLALHWDGTTWEVVTTGEASPTGSSSLIDLDVVPGGALWAVGSYNPEYDSRPLIEQFSTPCPLPPTATPMPPTPGTPIPTPPAIGCGVSAGIVPSANLTDRSTTLEDIEVISSNDVWAVGASSPRAITMHWDGAQWSVIPNPLASDGGLVSVAAVASNDVWAVGNTPTGPFSLHWNGSVWSEVPVPVVTLPISLNDVQTTASGDVWAVGYLTHPGSQPIYSTFTMRWTGTQWSTVSSPNGPGTSSVLNAVTVISVNDAWAVGYESLIYPPQEPDKSEESEGLYIRPLALHWNGQAWSIVTTPYSNEYTYRSFMSVDAVAGNDVWATGNNGVFAHWDGTTWTAIQGYFVGDVAAIAWNDVWFARGNSYLHWTGGQFVEVPGTGAGGNTFSISARGSEIWAAGWEYIGGITRPQTERWDGTAWRRVSTPLVSHTDNRLLDVAVQSDGTAWAVGNYADIIDRSVFLTQMWNGVEWVVRDFDSWDGFNLGSLNGVAIAPGSTRPWAVGQFGVGSTAVYRWNGQSWSRTASPSAGTGRNYLQDVDALAENDAWAIGYYHPTADPNVVRALTMHWDGAEWNIKPIPILGMSQQLHGVTMVSSDEVWAVGQYKLDTASPDRTFIARWDGTQWTVVQSPNLGTQRNLLRAVSANSANEVWAVGYYGPPGTGRALIMRWNGSQWSIVPAPSIGASDFLLKVEAISPGNVWAVGNYFTGGVPRTLGMKWDGSAWSIMSSPNAGSGANYLWGVAARIPSDVWVVGEYANSSGVRQTLTARYRPQSLSDVPPDNPFYPQIMCLLCRGIISGYADGTFRPNADVTRGQLSKIVSNSAGFNEDPGPQMFQDVPQGSTFYDWINRLARRGYIGGYDCGGVSEACVPPGNLPYFRPNANATRGQISKIVSNAAGFQEPVSGQTYHDVPTSNPFYEFIERLTIRGVMSGYQCGGQGEPCIPPDYKPYFRWGNNATRGQTSKIVANTFFPNCQTR